MGHNSGMRTYRPRFRPALHSAERGLPPSRAAPWTTSPCRRSRATGAATQATRPTRSTCVSTPAPSRSWTPARVTRWAPWSWSRTASICLWRRAGFAGDQGCFKFQGWRSAWGGVGPSEIPSGGGSLFSGQITDKLFWTKISPPSVKMGPPGGV